MQVVYERCCGLDVHKETDEACVLRPAAEGRVQREVRTFSTMTAALRALSAWLRTQQVEQVAMESTGVYWWPVFSILEEDGHAVLAVNPQHMKNVRGRKTDVQDAAWIADLLRHGLLQASFIPPEAIRNLRELTRYRTTQVQQRVAEVNRLQKVLESANIKLACVASDILGVSGQDMLHALLSTEDPDPAVLAELAQGRLRKKLGLLRHALEGRVKPHHRVLIARLLEHIAFLSESVAALQEEIERAIVPFQAAATLLRTIPGVNEVAAATIIAEIGTDMTCFGSAPHLASWAGLCPGNNQSGGKRRPAQTTKGNKWLRGILGEVAWAAIRKKGTSFGAQFRRVARRQGKLKAVVAVAHRLLRVIYYVLRDQVPYRELGPDHLSPQEAQRQLQRHVQHVEQLGYTVTLTPKEVA
jgi:transposase